MKRLTQLLFNKYCGPFLGQEPAAWAVQKRVCLRDKYLKCLNELGVTWKARGDREMMRTCYERGLEVKNAQGR